MSIFEPINRVYVMTPQGEGIIWLVTEYGTETDTLYTVIQESGEIWQWTHRDMKVLPNISFRRLNKNNEKE